MRKALLFAVLCLAPASMPAQSHLYFGGTGGLATLSGDGSAVVTTTSAGTSLFSPSNGPALRLFGGTHLFRYVSLQGDYGLTRNGVALISTATGVGGSSYYRVPETVTQHALIASVLVYFRDRRSRVRPYLSEGAGAVFIRNRQSSGAVIVGTLPVPPAVSSHASIALRTDVGLDVRMQGAWYFRYSFGETLTRNTFGDTLTPPEHRVPKNFQNLFGVLYQF